MLNDKEIDVEPPKEKKQQSQNNNNSQIREAQFMKRSNILKNWNKRNIKLDLEKNVLEIQHDKKKVKQVDISKYYALELKDLQKKKYHCLMLTAKNPMDRSLIYTEIMLGTESKEQRQEWYNYLSYINEKKKKNSQEITIEHKDTVATMRAHNEEKDQEFQQQQQPVENILSKQLQSDLSPVQENIQEEKKEQQDSKNYQREIVDDKQVEAIILQKQISEQIQKDHQIIQEEIRKQKSTIKQEYEEQLQKTEDEKEQLEKEKKELENQVEQQKLLLLEKELVTQQKQDEEEKEKEEEEEEGEKELKFGVGKDIIQQEKQLEQEQQLQFEHQQTKELGDLQDLEEKLTQKMYNYEENELEENKRHERDSSEDMEQYFAQFVKGQMMPKERSLEQQKYINQTIREAPLEMRLDVTKSINDLYHADNQADMWANIKQNYEPVYQSKQTGIYQNKKNCNQFKSIMYCTKKPQQLYEEIQYPTKSPHWHPDITKFEIFPAEKYGEVDLIQCQISFRNEKGEDQEQTMIYHRYFFEFNNIYFVICKTLSQDIQYQDCQGVSEKKDIDLILRIYPNNSMNVGNSSSKIGENCNSIFTVDLNVLELDKENCINQNIAKINFLSNFIEIDNVDEENEIMQDKDLTVSVINLSKKKPHKQITSSYHQAQALSGDRGSIKLESQLLGSTFNKQQDGGNEEFEEQKQENQGQIGEIKEEDSETYMSMENLKVSFINKDNAKEVFPQRLSSQYYKPQEQKTYHQILKEYLHLVRNNLTTQKAITSYHDQSYKQPKEDKFLVSSASKGHYAWEFDFAVDQKQGGLLFVNKDKIKKQKALVMTLLKKIGSNLLKGKSIMNISMPVTIFEDRSMLQRVASSMGPAPDYLKKAGETSDIVEQIKLTASYMLSSFVIGIQQDKPFNPILGETYQGRLNGSPLYMEQICHHPPICAYQLYGQGYYLTGTYSPEVDMSANSLQGTQKCHPQIYFPSNQKTLYCNLSSFMCYGIAVGQRTFNSVGKAYVFEPSTRIVLELQHNDSDSRGYLGGFFQSKCKNGKIDDLQGKIYQVDQGTIDQLMQNHKSYAKIKNVKINEKNIQLELGSFSGIWHEKLCFGKVCYWDSQKDHPYKLEDEINPLPSDSRYRLDAIYLGLDDQEMAQQYKEKGEQDQRADLKIKKNYKKKLSKIEDKK